jgi:hypothetical protein
MLKPIQIADDISELQVKGGRTMRPPSGYSCFNHAKARRLADEPLLMNTEYLTPSQSDQRCSNSRTLGPEVNFGSFCCKSGIYTSLFDVHTYAY